jgi:hypothetical protein
MNLELFPKMGQKRSQHTFYENVKFQSGAEIVKDGHFWMDSMAI